MPPVTPIFIPFGAVDTDTDDRLLSPGQLVEATNLALSGTANLIKSPPTALSVPAVTSSAGATSMVGMPEGLARAGDVLATVDARGEAWVLEDTTGTDRWRSVGRAKRFVHTSNVISPSGMGLSKGCVVQANGLDWSFATGGSNGSSGGINGYVVSIVDPVTKRQVLPPTHISAGAIYDFCAVRDTNDIWVLWVSLDNVVRCDRWPLASAGSRTYSARTTYQTLASGRELMSIDAEYISLHDKVFVAVAGCDEAEADWVYSHSYLDRATGAASSSPAAVTTTGMSGSKAGIVGVFSNQTAADGRVRYGVWVPGGTAGRLHLWLLDVNSTTLAILNRMKLDDRAGRSLSTVRAHSLWVTGCVSGTEVQVFASPGSIEPVADTGETIRTEPFYNTWRYVSGSTGITSGTWWRGSVPVTKPALMSSSFYMVTQYDDGKYTSGLLKDTFVDNWRSYHLRDISQGQGTVVDAAFVGYAAPTPSENAEAGTFAQPHVHPMNVNGSSLVAGLMVQNLGPRDLDVRRVAFSLTGTLPVESGWVESGMGPPASIPGYPVALVPGGIPTVFGPSDRIRELAPLLGPTQVKPYSITTGSTGDSLWIVQAVYRFADSQGNVYPSSPSAEVLLTASAGFAYVPANRFVTDPNNPGEVEFYITQRNGSIPYLLSTVRNNPDSDHVFTRIDTAANDPLRPDVAATHPIYTNGNALDATYPPQAVGGIAWGRRLLLWDETGTKIMPSFEYEDGVGPRFNELLDFKWNEGTGPIVGACLIDYENLALFKRDAVGLVYGEGPTDAGENPYVVRTLSTKKGLDDPRACGQGPGGAYFQDGTTGRICVVNAAGEIREIREGMEAFRTLKVRCVADDVTNHEMRFWMSDGSVLRLDYDHPTETQPLGRWLRDVRPAFSASVGALVQDDAWVALERTGALRAPATGSMAAVFMDGRSGQAGAVPYFWKIVTGDVGYTGQQMDMRLDRLTFGGRLVQSGSLVATAVTAKTVYNTDVTRTMTASMDSKDQWSFRPSGMEHVQRLRVTMEEVSGSVRGFSPTGMTIELQDNAKVAGLKRSYRR